MKKKQLLWLAALLFSVPSFGQLFNGKNLKGWHTIPGGKWEVKNRMIVGTSPASDERHGLLVTDKSYKNFILSVDYKAVKGNSGLYFRVEEIQHIVGVMGFQAEIDNEKDAGGLYETMGRAWVVQPKPEDIVKWYKKDKWNHMEVTAIGGDITVKVNGVVSAELKNDTGRTEGKVALQMHGGQDMEVYFKNVKLIEK